MSYLPQAPRMIDFIATVERNLELSPGYFLLTINLDQDLAVSAGQFAMVKPRDSYEPLLRRALAIYQTPGNGQLAFLYHVLGRGTQALSQLRSGSLIDCLAPLGNAWVSRTLEVPRRAFVVAGGIGSASVLMLCEQLSQSRIDTRILFGAANESAAIGCGLNDFVRLKLPLSVTTDDGTLGECGFVTAPLERALRAGEGIDATVYACGPWVMMRRVAELCEQHSVRCLVSLEAPMGCGFGVCVGCVVAVRADGPLGYGSYKRVCVDGSIFRADEIQWDVNAMG